MPHSPLPLLTTASALAAGLLCTAPARADAPRSSGFDFQPVLVSELDYRIHSEKDVEAEDGFSVTRLRLGARGRFADWASASMTVEMIGGEGPRIQDAFVAVSPRPDWEISFGAARTPLFASARDDQVWALPVPELPMVTRAFWPGYDAGLEVHRLATPSFPIEGWLRLGNGSGSALGNDNSDYAIDARLDAAFGRAVKGTPSSVPWGARLGAGAHAEAAEDRVGIGGTTADGFLFYRPPTVSGPRYVLEAHVVGYAGPVRLTVEAALAREGRSKDTDGNPKTPRVAQDSIESKGGYAELAWMITGPRRRHGAWPVDSPTGTWDWGGLELGARVERLWLGERARDVTAGGATSGSAALRWWVTSFLAVSAAGYVTAYDVAPLEEPEITQSWLGLFRATVRMPDDVAHLH